jgi:hypothetical protein
MNRAVIIPAQSSNFGNNCVVLNRAVTDEGAAVKDELFVPIAVTGAAFLVEWI